MLLLLSNVIDADHQNSCLVTNKGHFASPLWVLIGVLVQCHEKYFTSNTCMKCAENPFNIDMFYDECSHSNWICGTQ